MVHNEQKIISNRVKIAIDLRIFGTKPGGLGRYNQKFLENLIKTDTKNDYFLIFKEKPDFVLPANFKIIICNCHWYGLKEQFLIPYILYKLKPDLVHFTHFNVPIFYYGRFVVTIHDLIMTKFPSQRSTTLNRYLFKVKYWFYNQVIKQAIKKAEKVIAVSQYTAEDIKKYFSLSDKEAKKIQVVYEGVSKEAKIKNNSLNLPKNFFLYVGNAYPHKNLEFLVKTFQEFIKKYPEYHLVLVGNKNYFYTRLEEETKHTNVIFTGHLSDEDLTSYYKAARAYIFPSLYEGFGLPPLEAMAHGLPVLSSNASCLPEILEDSVLYFNPDDQEDLFSKMNSIISDQLLRDLLIAKGYKQIEKYSWGKMTNEILAIYGTK